MRQTRRADHTSFIPISAPTDVYKYSFFPRTLLDWTHSACWNLSQVLVVCKRVSWSGRLSHDTPAVKGDAHCWIFAEEPKSVEWHHTPDKHLFNCQKRSDATHSATPTGQPSRSCRLRQPGQLTIRDDVPVTIMITTIRCVEKKLNLHVGTVW